MERVDLIVENLTIDARKAEYLRTVHRVELLDVFEVYNNAPAFFLFAERWMVYDMIGPNLAGRFLVVGIRRVDQNEWAVVTAFWNDDGRAQRQYER